MFTFSETIEFEAPVPVRYPGASGEIEAEFTARFVLLPEEDLLGLGAAAEDEPGLAEMLEAEKARLRRVWTGWSGIAVETGETMEFSEANREKLLSMRHVRIAVARAYAKAALETYEGN